MAFPSMRTLEASENAGPITLMLVFGLIHRSLKTRGFTLTRSPLSTDAVTMGLLVVLSNAWALIVALPGHGLSTGPLTVPWIAVIFSWLYAGNMVSIHWYGSSANKTWKMDCSNGPFSWRESLNPYCMLALYLALSATQVSCSMILIFEGTLIQGTMSIVGLGLFFLCAFPNNEYVSAAHRYNGDMLRIALPTSHIEGTVYVLPSRKCGFEALWSPKVRSEHKQTDAEMMALFSSMRTGSYSLSEPLKRLRTTMSAFNEKVTLSDQEVNDLAEWVLMEPGSYLATHPTKAKRPSNIHLIGRDLLYALAHAEYLIFMRKDALRPNLRKRLGSLREAKRSGGLDEQEPVPTIGYREGIAGYQDAVRYIYGLFNENVDAWALEPPALPSHMSFALNRQTKSTGDYVGSLWTLCLQHSESTFSTMYMFSCIWFMEVGNVGGFHIFPLQCQSHAGDLTAWRIIWRQGWYECLMAQLIASSPLVAFAFAAGLLQ
ncbi:hypothetical protein N7G274_008672 [Stereocaulon virgatum]|uniref:Uncharacterized protein n=1 Tax=Stereocaulon virgatum TaxID=373712 RepID=A0ABR3ZY52_9LECA